MHYLVKGLSVPVEVDNFKLSEMEIIHPLLTQLEIHDEPLKRRLIIHKIGVILRGTQVIPKLARIVGISTGYLANGEKRVFLATYLKKEIADDFDLDTKRPD